MRDGIHEDALRSWVSLTDKALSVRKFPFSLLAPILAYVGKIQEDADRLMTKVCQVREVITTGGTQEPRLVI